MKSRWRPRIVAIILCGALFWGIWLPIGRGSAAVTGLYWAAGTIVYIAGAAIRDRQGGQR